MENTPIDPRIGQATSVEATDGGKGDEDAGSSSLKIMSASSDPQMFTLPWNKSLIDWPEDLFVNLPRGISRHVVRFVRVGTHIYAMKEITRPIAEKEYETLRQLEKLDIPAVKPIAVVTGRHNDEGEELEAMLVTEHLKFSLPYRALFARNIRSDTAQRLIDALAVLMVRLHLIGFYWGDVSLSNVLFLHDADQFTAFLVDAETGAFYAKLTDGQREYDMDLARMNIIGELMDLNSGNLLPAGVDEVGVGSSLVDRYHQLWSALTDVSTYKPDEMWRIEKRVDFLNTLGFDVDELEVTTTPDGNQVRVRPRVVDAGYASRKLKDLTGLDAQENQARRLLNDLDTYRLSTWRQDEDLKSVATDWMRDVFEPTVRMIPDDYKSRIEPAQFFHEVLTHRWYLGEQLGHDVPIEEAARSYINEHLKDYKIDTQVMRAINLDADSGVVDDEGTYGSNADLVEENLDDSVWTQDLSERVREKVEQARSEAGEAGADVAAGAEAAAGEAGASDAGAAAASAGAAGAGGGTGAEGEAGEDTAATAARDAAADEAPTAQVAAVPRFDPAHPGPAPAAGAPQAADAQGVGAAGTQPAAEEAAGEEAGGAPVPQPLPVAADETMLQPVPPSRPRLRSEHIAPPVASKTLAALVAPEPVPPDAGSAITEQMAPPFAADDEEGEDVQRIPAASDGGKGGDSAEPKDPKASQGPKDTDALAETTGETTEVIYPLPPSEAVLTVEPAPVEPEPERPHPRSGMVIGTSSARKDETFADYRVGRDFAPRHEQPVIVPPTGPTTPPDSIIEAVKADKAAAGKADDAVGGEAADGGETGGGEAASDGATASDAPTGKPAASDAAPAAQPPAKPSKRK